MGGGLPLEINKGGGGVIINGVGWWKGKLPLIGWGGGGVNNKRGGGGEQ